VDTHSQRIRTDPEVYLAGEVNRSDDDGNSDSNSDDDNGDEGEDEGEDEGDPAEVFSGMKRKATTGTRSSFPAKKARTAPSAPALGAIDDRRPDITLIDAPVGEDVLQHPYGRHGCLYMEVKVDANKKPNPQEVVSRLFLKVPYY